MNETAMAALCFPFISSSQVEAQMTSCARCGALVNTWYTADLVGSPSREPKLIHAKWHMHVDTVAGLAL